MKLRTIITQDAEVDDQNSLRHFLFYVNEVDLKGIVQTSSKFHWEGVPGKQKVRIVNEYELGGGEVSGPYEESYRWPGTQWMFRVIADYEKDLPKLKKHAEGYPSADYLRSITKVGNIGYEGEMDVKTDGSELIKNEILADDERPLYIQVWGGTNTIARALMDVKAENEGRADWEELHKTISEKVILTACGEQDPTFRCYIAEEWPGIKFVKTLQMGSYAYLWFRMPEGESKDTLRAPFMKAEIQNGKSALADGYSLWKDGHRYIGEAMSDQFGVNPDIDAVWWAGKFAPPYAQYDFLSEGDSPTFFPLFNWGFRTLEDWALGGIGGRYQKSEGQKNSKGELLDVWDIAKDTYIDREGNAVVEESMWPYVCDIQRDFAARVDWVSKENYADAEHQPELKMAGGVDYEAAAKETVTLTAEAVDPDGGEVAVNYRIYNEISTAPYELKTDGVKACVTVGEGAESGQKVHVIVQAKKAGHYKLTHYQHVIITVK